MTGDDDGTEFKIGLTSKLSMEGQLRTISKLKSERPRSNSTNDLMIWGSQLIEAYRHIEHEICHWQLSILLVFGFIALFQAPITLTGSTSLPIDHVRNPATNSLAPATTRMRAGLPRLARSLMSLGQRRRVNVETWYGALSAKLAIWPAYIERGNR